MPNSAQLPYGLKSLARRNAVTIQHQFFHPNVNYLIEQLETALEVAEKIKTLQDKKRKEKEAQEKRQAEIDTLLSQANTAISLEDW